MKTELDISTVLDEVVHQFSDRLAFFRELIQNAIDAGTGSVDIELSFDEAEQRACIVVQDSGEGMTRRIIEGKLLRLFSSGKDDDLTKIGRFGIGFVSVFAIAPSIVVVDTGREGQYWRVLFEADRSYELFALPHPVEGTRVKILVPMKADEFAPLVSRTRKVVKHWCKHASVPIYFQGEELGEAFDLDSTCKLTFEEQGTRIVIGMVESDKSIAGYYNRGLTLKESEHSPWPWAAFKIDSRYLEHTLTRDQIIEDGHFQKAHAILHTLATERLPEALRAGLVATAAAQEQADYFQHVRYLTHYLRCDRPFPRAWLAAPLLRGMDNTPRSVRDLRRTPQGPGLSSGDRELARFWSAENQRPVLLDDTTASVANLLELLEVPFVDLSERYFLLDQVRPPDPEKTGPLKEATERLLANLHMEVSAVEFVYFSKLPRRMQSMSAALVGAHTGFIDADAVQVQAASPRTFTPSSTLLVPAESETVQALFEAALLEPEWAACALLTLILDERDLRAIDFGRQRLDILLSQGVEMRRARHAGENV